MFIHPPVRFCPLMDMKLPSASPNNRCKWANPDDCRSSPVLTAISRANSDCCHTTFCQGRTVDLLANKMAVTEGWIPNAYRLWETRKYIS